MQRLKRGQFVAVVVEAPLAVNDLLPRRYSVEHEPMSWTNMRVIASAMLVAECEDRRVLVDVHTVRELAFLAGNRIR